MTENKNDIPQLNGKPIKVAPRGSAQAPRQSQGAPAQGRPGQSAVSGPSGKPGTFASSAVTGGKPGGRDAMGGKPAGAGGAAVPKGANGRQPGAADQKGKPSKKMTVIIVIVCLLVALGIIFALFMSFGGGAFFDSSARSGQAPYKSEEEIQAELNRQVEEGMLNISIASTIEFEDGTSEGTAYIENVPNNHYVMKVRIDDNNTGETLYESGGIKPGEYIEKIALARDLDAGVYDATATFTAYDQTTLEEVGEAAAIVTLNVKN